MSKSQSDSGYNERGGNSKRGGDSRSGGGARGDKWSQKGEKDSTKPLGKAPPPADKSGKKMQEQKNVEISQQSVILYSIIIAKFNREKLI